MEELKAQESEALDIIESLLDAADMKCTGPLYADDPPRSGMCRIPEDDAAKLRQYIANRRAEPENKPLTLEQLKQMEGEQVWIPETEAYFSGHGIVNVKEEKVYASDEENDYYPFDEYGAWLAYARKPEGSST